MTARPCLATGGHAAGSLLSSCSCMHVHCLKPGFILLIQGFFTVRAGKFLRIIGRAPGLIGKVYGNVSLLFVPVQSVSCTCMQPQRLTCLQYQHLVWIWLQQPGLLQNLQRVIKRPYLSTGLHKCIRQATPVFLFMSASTTPHAYAGSLPLTAILAHCIGCILALRMKGCFRASSFAGSIPLPTPAHRHSPIIHLTGLHRRRLPAISVWQVVNWRLGY